MKEIVLYPDVVLKWSTGEVEKIEELGAELLWGFLLAALLTTEEEIAVVLVDNPLLPVAGRGMVVE